MSESLTISGGKALIDGAWQDTAVALSDGTIHGFESLSGGSFEADGCYIVPGIVDLHGDAFERAITPRPNVSVPTPMGLMDTDNTLVANGYTTYYYAITDGFEPGPRSRGSASRLVDQIHTLSPHLRCRSAVHMRHELANTLDIQDVVEWMEKGLIGILGFNDHLPDLNNDKQMEKYGRSIRQRMSITNEDLRKMMEDLTAQHPIGVEQQELLAKAAKEFNCSLASHDDPTPAMIERTAKLGVSICEFPLNLETARAAEAHGQTVLMGAPNLIRGTSHVGAISVREALAQKAVDALCSDYHFPTLLGAPFLIDELGLMPLEKAWDLVSRNPAKAAGLDDRGLIAEGQLADLVIIRHIPQVGPRVVATIVGGRIVHLTESERLAA